MAGQARPAATPANLPRAARSSRPPRVVFVNRYFFPDESATAQMLSDIAFGLAAGGHEIHIVCSRQLYDAPAAKLAARESLRAVTVHRIWTTWFGRRRLLGRALDYASFYLAAAAILTRLLRAGDIVVAKTDPPLISVIAAAAARLKGATLINWLQDVFPEVASRLGANPLPRGLDHLLRRLRDASLRAARCNVVLGSRMQEYLAGSGIAPDKIRIIENWADSEAVTPKPAANSELRLRLGLQDRFVAAYSGNLGRAHEYETLLEAAQLLRADAGIQFLMIGGGANMACLRAATTLRGLDNFLFMPYQPRSSLSDSLAAADVHLACLIPTLEGLIVPSKFYGILAAGRPVVFIGDPDGELPRVIRRANCGAAVASGDATALAAVLRRLRSDPSTCAAMGARARDLLVRRFSARRALDSWIAVLDGQAGARALGLDDLQIDEEFIGGAHAAEIESGAPVHEAATNDE